MLSLLLGLGGARPAGAAEPPPVPKPRIVTRAQWGSKPMPIPEARRQVPVWVTLHHAGDPWKKGADPAEFVRRMQSWGQNRARLENPPRDTFWPDLPYHYLIAPDGRIFEGRPVEYEPESNTDYALKGNIGVELMGDFNLQRPSVEQLRSAARLTAWLCRKHGIDLSHVRGHQDAAPDQTDCPGRDFYRYLQDGRFKAWVLEALDGKIPDVKPGPPLPGGPADPIPGAAPQ
ncbi:MAG: peptidoglycan recognition family protein [Elusimicrobia bacterium]|nr:peptidoglycan recognition family protein [Elusimicrobiota bacterium]